jgi:hypothetical protein
MISQLSFASIKPFNIPVDTNINLFSKEGIEQLNQLYSIFYPESNPNLDTAQKTLDFLKEILGDKESNLPYLVGFENNGFIDEIPIFNCQTYKVILIHLGCIIYIDKMSDNPLKIKELKFFNQSKFKMILHNTRVLYGNNLGIDFLKNSINQIDVKESLEQPSAITQIPKIQKTELLKKEPKVNQKVNQNETANNKVVSIEKLFNLRLKTMQKDGNFHLHLNNLYVYEFKNSNTFEVSILYFKNKELFIGRYFGHHSMEDTRINAFRSLCKKLNDDLKVSLKNDLESKRTWAYIFTVDNALNSMGFVTNTEDNKISFAHTNKLIPNQSIQFTTMVNGFDFIKDMMFNSYLEQLSKLR